MRAVYFQLLFGLFVPVFCSENLLFGNRKFEAVSMVTGRNKEMDVGKEVDALVGMERWMFP